MIKRYLKVLQTVLFCLFIVCVYSACDLLSSDAPNKNFAMENENPGIVFNEAGTATSLLFGRTSITFNKQVEQGIEPEVEGSLQFSIRDLSEWEIVEQSNIGFFPAYSEERSFEQFRLHLAFKDKSIPQTVDILDAELKLTLTDPLKANNEASAFRPGVIHLVTGVQTQVPLTAKESFQNSGVILPALKLLVSEDDLGSEITINIADHASFIEGIQKSLAQSQFLVIGIRSASENSQGALVNLESISVVITYNAKPTFVNPLLPRNDVLIPTLGNEGVLFEWTASKGSPPITYTIEFDTLTSFEEPIVSINQNQSTTFMFSGNGLKKGKRNYWRVVSRNQFGMNTSRSLPLRVRPDPPENVVASTMAVSGLAGIVARLDWDPVQGINTYLIKIESGNPLVFPVFTAVQDTFYLGPGPSRLGGSDFTLSVASMIETQDYL